MPQTPKMGFPYPTYRQKPFWDTWEALMAMLDASIWASIENSGLLLSGGGVLSLNPSTDELSWTAAFRLLDLITGGSVRIDPATIGGVTDGAIVYVTVSRPILGEMLLTMSVANTLGNDVNKVFIGIRRGSDFVLRPQSGLELPVAPIGEAVFVDQKKSGADGGSVGAGAPLWYPRPLMAEEDNVVPDLVELLSWDVEALSGTGPNYTVTVAGDQTAHFQANHKLDIDGSTDNDNDGVAERYTIVSATLSGGNTDIVVTPPAGVTFSTANPDGKVFTGRIRFHVGGRYLFTGEFSQEASGSMCCRVAKVTGNTYGTDGEVATQVGDVSPLSASSVFASASGDVALLPLGVVMEMTAGDIVEIQSFFETSVLTAAKALGGSNASIGSVFARVRIKRSE